MNGDRSGRVAESGRAARSSKGLRHPGETLTLRLGPQVSLPAQYQLCFFARAGSDAQQGSAGLTAAGQWVPGRLGTPFFRS